MSVRTFVPCLALLVCACATESTPRVTAEGSSAPSTEAAPSAMTAPAPSATTAPRPSAMAAPAPSAMTAPAPSVMEAPGGMEAPGSMEAAPARLAAAPGQEGAAPQVTGTERMQQVGQALEAAIREASQVEGDDHCSTAYSGLQVMITRLRAAIPDAPAQNMPNRDVFLEVCRQLPPEAQQCMIVGYAMEHRADCQRITATLDPALRSRLENVMRSGGRAPGDAPTPTP